MAFHSGPESLTQHELMVSVLYGAGGVDPRTRVAPSYCGRIADVFFPCHDVIVEVKSLTTDRAASPEVSEAVSQMFVESTHLGAPVIFGSKAFRLHELPPVIAKNTLRIAGHRVLDEAKSANRQIKATKEALARPNALGVLALITPPFRLDRRSIISVVGDAMRDNRCKAIDVLLLVETPLSAPVPYRSCGNSFLSLHRRPKGIREIPIDLTEAIGTSWADLTHQQAGHAEEENYHLFGATS